MDQKQYWLDLQLTKEPLPLLPTGMAPRNASASARLYPALEDSYEASFHYADMPNFLLPLRDSDPETTAFRDSRLERAIGVIYLPRTERQSHYFEARLSDQFDVVIHFDETRALEPLERQALWQTGEPPESYPTGM